MSTLPKEIILKSEEETLKFAAEFARTLTAGDVVALCGELGAGKTTICRKIIQTLCGENTRVASPTFNLLQTYDTSLCEIYHFDLYRLKHAEEIYELGFEDALNDNITLIEWPEIISHLLPKNAVELKLSLNNEGHRICKISGIQ